MEYPSWTNSSSFTTEQTVNYSEDGFITTTRRPFRGYAFPFDLSSFSVPIAITVILCMVLCLAVFYTKARRRQQRLRSGPQNNLRSISGGVPMSVHAYRNYGMHLGAGDPAAELPTPTFITEQPPPYEIAINTPSGGAGYTSPHQPYPVHIIAPPSYQESVSHEQPSTTVSEVQANPHSLHHQSMSPDTGITPSPSQLPLTETVSNEARVECGQDPSMNNNSQRREKKNTTMPSMDIATQNVSKLDNNEVGSDRTDNLGQASNGAQTVIDDQNRNIHQPTTDL